MTDDPGRPAPPFELAHEREGEVMLSELPSLDASAMGASQKTSWSTRFPLYARERPGEHVL